MRRWYGQFLGFIAGWLLLRHPVGALIGWLVGYWFDHDAFTRRPSPRPPPAGPPGDADVDWAYRVLGVREDASDAQIDRAYRRLISQYHPDRVAGAAPELRKIAEQKSREINAAYDRIQTLRRKT
ncbi:DnaJ domain-containing protein [Thermomonas sp. S9]|uniref:J domain-containing protein n=1 Tax=Thermomonas sp. S9 TaxID=2885203 RepID=UPI00216AEBFD|nr:DnaJ domain-containing protein [Thermomonas sp. S9]MCR6495300.1 DnaJ domain-containing protein [Thermomonas sp. S9]